MSFVVHALLGKPEELQKTSALNSSVQGCDNTGILGRTIMNSKSKIRDKMLKQRESLLPEEKIIAEKELIKEWKTFYHKKEYSFDHVALYWPTRNEISCLGIINHLFEEGHHCYLPVINDKEKKIFTFNEFTHNSELEKNEFGIMEPINGEVASLNKLTLIIAPLLAFDDNGSRLGMGMGFYDFALRNRPKISPLYIGLAYKFQKEVCWESESHDVKLDGVITTSEFIKF